MKIRQGEKQMNLNSARISDFEINNWLNHQSETGP